MLWITVLLSGNKVKTSLPHETSLYTFPFPQSSVGRGRDWKHRFFGQPPGKFCCAITIVNYFRKCSKIAPTSQITSTLILFLSPVVWFFFFPLSSNWLKKLASATESQFTSLVHQGNIVHKNYQQIILRSLEKANTTTMSFKNFL